MAKRKSEPKSNAFIDALTFCSTILKDVGNPHETCLFLNNRTIRAFNGILSIGCDIDTDINVFANNSLLLNALKKCKDNYSITQLDQSKLSIKSDKFKAIIPCLNPELMTPVYPDPPVVALTNAFREALSAVSILATEGAQSVILASVLISGASLIATDRKVMIEYWTGLDLPTGIAVPKSFAVALSKIDKNLAKFGYGKSSITIWFEDGSFIRTQTFAEPWPDVQSILNRKANVRSIPDDFYRAVDAVQPFSETGDVYFGNNILRSHFNGEQGAQYECSGISEGPIFSAKHLKIIQPYVKEVDFDTQGGMLIFQGDRVRGAIAGRSR